MTVKIDTMNVSSRPDGEITVVGGRGSGKTNLLLQHAYAEAERGKKVIYESSRARMTADAFHRAVALFEHRPTVERIYRANGRQSIHTRAGGVVRFLSGSTRGLIAEVHILDNCDKEPIIGATHVVRSALR